MEQIHGTALSIKGEGILIRGASGSGKSDLALRLINAASARLIADDRVNLSADGSTILMSPPPEIAGLLEVRGLGAAEIGCEADIPLRLIIDLKPAAEIERMPERKWQTILDHEIPVFDLYPFEPSAPDKLGLALQIATGRATLIE